MMKINSVFKKLFLKNLLSLDQQPGFADDTAGHEAEPLRGTNSSACVQ